MNLNLLAETIEVLKNNNKTPSDVIWCGSKKFGYFTWKEFADVANTEYDDSFGAPYVAQDLLVVGKGFCLERREYDGSEWWVFVSKPIKPKKHNIPKALTIDQARELGYDTSCGWEDLNNMNGKEK